MNGRAHYTALELQKYWRPQNGAYFFHRVGLTLPGVCRTIADIEGTTEQQSYVRKAVKGSATLSRSYTDLLAQALRLDPSERWDLHAARIKDEYADQKIRFDPSVSPFMIRAYNLNISMLKVNRISGNTDSAVDHSELLEEDVKKILFNAIEFDLTSDLWRILCRSYYERAIAIIQSEPSESVMNSVGMLPEDIRRVCTEQSFDDLLWQSSAILGGSYYVSGDADRAVEFCSNALADSIPAYDWMWLMRFLIISKAMLHEEDNVSRLENNIRERLDRDGLESDARLLGLEGIARAQTILEQKRALTTVDDARRVYTLARGREERIPIRGIVLTKTEVLALSRWRPRDTALMMGLLGEGLCLAREYPFRRHRSELACMQASIQTGEPIQTGVAMSGWGRA